tara:strand:- start:1263 stop:2447 length:1185 start_codon:yes stop_codon:yes gene_type:complete
LYFQSLDDKSECVGIYTDGKLYFDDLPTNLTKTWRHSGAISGKSVEYAWIMSGGKNLADVCPPKLASQLAVSQAKFKAYLQSFRLAKINLRELCFYDLVPEDFLLNFCDTKNLITEHVFDTYEKPENYEHLADMHRLLHKIKFNDLNTNNKNCRELMTSSRDRTQLQRLLNGPQHIDYNLFGTVTGRLTTFSNSLPILTMKKIHRKIVKPHNDWFMSLDYNGAELRTVLALGDEPQPDWDIHQWNAKNVFGGVLSRDESKEKFFAWLYNPESDAISSDLYNRDKILSNYYVEGRVQTPGGRSIVVEERKAFNYLIQSTTADLVMERAIEIDKFLIDKKSFISHIVHDEIVIDLHDSERSLAPLIKNIFENNSLGQFRSNINAGKNYYDLKELII